MATAEDDATDVFQVALVIIAAAGLLMVVVAAVLLAILGVTGAVGVATPSLAQYAGASVMLVAGLVLLLLGGLML